MMREYEKREGKIISFFFFFHQLPKVNQGFENLIKSKWIDVEMIL